MNTLRMTSVVSATLLGAWPFVSVGESVGWTNVAERSAKWLTAANWTNATGQVLSSAPVSGEDIVLADVPELPVHNAYVDDSTMLGEQSIAYEGSGNYALAMGAVTGDAKHTLTLDKDGGAGDSIYNLSRSITIGDPTGFFGFWLVGGIELAVTTPASATLTPVYHNFSAKHNPVLTGTDAAGTTVIESLYDAGALSKAGAGTLRVKATSGAQTIVYHNDGKLVLDGRTAGGLTNLLGKAAVHLDASVTSTLVRETGADGLVSVLEWKDVRGKADALAFKWHDVESPGWYMIQNANPPFLSAAAQSPTGLPLVDFGARSKKGDAEYPERGRTNCFLQLVGADGKWVDLTNVREAFYAVAAPKGAADVQIVSGKNRINYMCSSDAELFDGKYADPAVRHGDIIFNMQKHAYNGFTKQQLSDLYTLGVGVGRDTGVSYLGTRQLYASCTGGSRMGEVILFTNDLTRAERLDVCRYLDAKWRTGETAQNDLTALHVAASTATVEIPEADRTARVGSLEVPGKVFTKTGEGTLVVGHATTGTKINVQGGKVLFAGEAVTDTAIAVEPYVHLDAASIGADDVEVVDDVTYVNTWKDETYGAARQATAALTETSRPTLVTSALVGRPVVDFGTRDKSGGTGAWMKLCNWNDSTANQAYAGFIVLRFKDKDTTPHFGSSQGMTFYRDSAASILSPYYKNMRTGSAIWRVNGSVERPFTSSAINRTDSFLVLSFSSAYPVRLDAIAADKGGQTSVKDSGGSEIGEVVVYDRPLTESEILSTEAYLMKKWLGDTSASATSIGEISLNDDQPVELTNARDLAIDKVTGGSGVITKEGTGSATIKSFSVQPTSLAVNAGSLTMCVSGETFLDEALFHLDASHLQTLDFTVDANGVTNVNTWSDVRGNGFKATAYTDELATAKPHLVSVESRPGSGRMIAALDFGGYSWKTNDYTFLSATPSAAMKYNATETIRHAITIFADAHDAHQQSVFSKVDGHDFQRNWNTGSLYWNDNKWNNVDIQVLKAASIVRNAKFGTWLDGVEASENMAITEGFHIFDFLGSQSRTTQTHDWTMAVNAIAMSAGSAKANSGEMWGFDYSLDWLDRGGQYVAEQIGFSRMLTPAEQLYLNAYLNYKWFGSTNPGALVTNEIAEVSVATGSTLSFEASDGVTVQAASLTGTGTINARELIVADDFDVTLVKGWTSGLVVNGAVVFGDDLEINVTVDRSNGRIPAGLYPILTATEFVNFDATKIPVNVLTAHSGIGTVELVRVDNTLYLKTKPKGSLLLFR